MSHSGNVFPDKADAVLELLLKSSKAITSEIELEKLVQRVTDVGTELTGAAFGAFFYNVLKNGEKYLLYTISGVAKEAFSKFPNPRNTKIFDPTFTGKGVVRYDDVTQAPQYGKNAPHNGMPKGHLPVRSYLAAPVKSSITGEVIGGLFFGHPEAGIFDEDSEVLVEGIAAQAAVAMANAQLFEEKKKSELLLRQQREQYKSIFNSTSDAILIFDQNGILVEANPSAMKMLGNETERIFGIAGNTILESPEQFDAIKGIVNSGREFKGPGVLKRNGDTPLEIEITASPFKFNNETHMLAVLRDVSVNREAEKAIKASEEYAHIISYASPVGLWMSNETGEVKYVNQTWIDWTNKPFAEHLGHGWLDCVIEEDRPKTRDQYLSAFNAREIFQIEFRIKRRDGQTRWCLASGGPYYNSSGIFEGYAGSSMDITDRKQVEVVLSNQNNLIKTIANNATQALFMMDDRQFCTYMNPAAEKMTGFTLEEVQEKPLHYYIHHTHPDGRHYPIEECAIDSVLPAVAQTAGEDFFIHRDGHFYPVFYMASPILENGVPCGTVIEVRDTTEEKRIQQELMRTELEAKEMLEQKVKERTSELEKTNYELLQFTSVASHDLKEPLRKISLFGKLLRDRAGDVLEPMHMQYVEKIVQSSQRMNTLIEDLLNFSRLSQKDIGFEKVDLNAVLKQILSDFEVSIQEKNATVTFDSLPVVNGIPSHLGQVFQNLISNSLKFAHPERFPVIELSSKTVTCSTGSYYKITYRDNGIGFANDYAKKIFDIFQRLHTKESYEGTGVGLAIVKKIVSLHHGMITANGVENEGSTFEILLPEHPTPL